MQLPCLTTNYSQIDKGMQPAESHVVLCIVLWWHGSHTPRHLWAKWTEEELEEKDKSVKSLGCFPLNVTYSWWIRISAISCTFSNFFLQVLLASLFLCSTLAAVFHCDTVYKSPSPSLHTADVHIFSHLVFAQYNVNAPLVLFALHLEF